MSVRRRPLLAGAAAAFLPRPTSGQPAPLTIAVYPGIGETLWTALTTAFTAETGIQARIFAPPLPASSIAQAAGHPAFDVALIAAYALPGLVTRNLLQPLTPETIPSLRTVPGAYLPRGPTGILSGAPIYFSLYGIAYNTELATASDFATWNNLLDAKWRGQVPLNRPTMLAAYDLTLFAKLGGGDATNVQPGYDFIRKLAANAHSVYSSMATFEAELARGEVVAAPFYSAEITMQKRQGAPSLGFTMPKEGGLMLPYLLVLPTGAPRPADAIRFLDWMLQPKAQLMLAAGAGVWPMNGSISLPPDLARELGGNVADTMARNYDPDWYIVGSALEDRIRRVEEIIRSVP